MRVIVAHRFSTEKVSNFVLSFCFVRSFSKTIMTNVSVKKFNALAKKDNKKFRYMRYNPKTMEVKVVEDADARHEAAERNLIVQITLARANLIQGAKITPVGSQSAYNNDSRLLG